MKPRESKLRGDVVLSSGFLGFASHLGFLDGLREASFAIDALVGTSSGALVGSLFAASMEPDDIERLLTKSPPITHVGLSYRPWRGLFDLGPLIRLLERELPPTFEGLTVPFAVGVSSPVGEHQLITSGPLPLAVAASCAVPNLFAPVCVGGVSFRDGGATDRLGVRSWRAWRPACEGVVHQIQRSMGVERNTELGDLRVVISPRSRNSLLRLRNFDVERQAARARTRELLGVVAS